MVAHDKITNWYEQQFLPSTAAAGADPLGIGAALDARWARATVSAWRPAAAPDPPSRLRGLGWTLRH